MSARDYKGRAFAANAVTGEPLWCGCGDQLFADDVVCGNCHACRPFREPAEVVLDRIARARWWAVRWMRTPFIYGIESRARRVMRHRRLALVRQEEALDALFPKRDRKTLQVASEAVNATDTHGAEPLAKAEDSPSPASSGEPR